MDTSLNVLVIEDNDELRDLTVEVLTSAGHRVRAVDCAEAVPELGGRVDLVVLDLNLPGEDGLALAQRLRGTQPDIGIVMVTARGLTVDRLQGYGHGADVYLTKPVAFDELLATIAALGRRLQPHQPEQRLQLQAATLQLMGVDGQVVSLNAAEANLLTAFSLAADSRLETWQLLDLPDSPVAQDPKAALELRLVRLRKKLEQAGAPSGSIKALRGWGYQLCVPLRIVA